MSASAQAEGENGGSVNTSISVVLTSVVSCDSVTGCHASNPEETGEPVLVVNTPTDKRWVY